MIRRLGMVFVAVALVAVAGCSKDKEPVDEEQPAAQAPTPAEPQMKAIDEVEPNEKTDQAMAIGQTCVVNATLEAAAGGDKRANDWYRIAPQGEKVVRIAASGIGEEDIDLQFLDDDKNRLFRVDSGGAGAGEVYANLTLQRGVYLRLRGSKGGNPKGLRAGPRGAQPNATGPGRTCIPNRPSC